MSDDKNNTGNRNTGYSNTGYSNTGDSNTGNSNTGNWNTGYRNTGYSNTGDSNTGNCNTGYSNTGNRNTGYSNTGNCNTGYSNTGDSNTGNWNTCNKETGCFNTEQSKTVRIFNKDYSLEDWDNLDKPDFLYFTLTDWVDESDMTEKEKDDNETYKTTGGFLKQYDYKEAFQASYNKASDEEKAQLLTLPNFDAAVFFEISGINVNEISKRDKEIETLQEQVKEMMKKIEELKN